METEAFPHLLVINLLVCSTTLPRPFADARSNVAVARRRRASARPTHGHTIVARVPDDQVSVDPSVLVNFVCRCAAGAFAPMVQIGASTSKDLPAILVGGGLRLFGAGKGDVAIGGGLMLAWVKDLQTLKEGDVVTGTKDIEADLGYGARPRPRGYFGIQYKF